MKGQGEVNEGKGKKGGEVKKGSEGRRVMLMGRREGEREVKGKEK